MPKIDDEIKDIKAAVNELNSKIEKLQFFLVQIINKIDVGGTAAPLSVPTPVISQGQVSVDLTPLEEKIEKLTKMMISKADIEPLAQNLAKMRDERLKEAEETVNNVTVLLEKGLALTELTASLKEIEAHLQELVTPARD